MNGDLDLDGPGNAPSERSFLVVVSDQLNEVTATVTVNVTMVNEFVPVMGRQVYHASVLENDTSGHLVQEVTI